jgi:hypothetical protein
MEIEEQIVRAEEVAESPITIEGENKVELEAQTAKVESAGYVKIYDTNTGEMSLCNRNMLVHHLKKRRPDNSIVFTTIKPKFAPKRGKLKCLLHPDSPNRAHYDEMGLAVCRKSNITSPYQVIRHMQKRHKVEYGTIKEEEARLEKQREREERQEDRKLQAELLKTATKTATKEAPLYVSDKEKK